MLDPSKSVDRYLEGRTAAVTGGLSGQGLAIAAELARRGANICAGSMLDVHAGSAGDAAEYPDREALAEVRESLRRHGVLVRACHLDVRRQELVDRFVEEARAMTGSVDILINAAGTTAEQGVCGHGDELWNRIIDTNLTGAFRMARACLPDMMEKRWGRIINIGSTAASVGWKDNPAYCASKAGLLGLTRCIALEGASRGVSCVMVSPTWVETGLMRRNVEQVAARSESGRGADELTAEIVAQNPQGRLIKPHEIASLCAYLCRDEAFGITAEDIQVSGGAMW
ncbi:MAG: SDR family oxidoreductase [Rhodobacteraceae bacterium]|nr:SDR family oxidoreductase [Paracoccaceae bacterium]